MKKRYQGQGSRRPYEEEIILEWFCPNCHGSNVRLKKDDRYRLASWVDGDLQTRDECGYWHCNKCAKEILGSKMISVELSRKKLERPEYDLLSRDEKKRIDQEELRKELYDENYGVLPD